MHLTVFLDCESSVMSTCRERCLKTITVSEDAYFVMGMGGGELRSVWVAERSNDAREQSVFPPEKSMLLIFSPLGEFEGHAIFCGGPSFIPPTQKFFISPGALPADA